jgi:alkyl sulfatase BDS1-like metallo-beta-lactamase superfamily hydrolase
MLALKTTFDPQAAPGLRARYALRLGEERFRVEVADGRLDLARGEADQPDATIQTDSATLRRLVFGDRTLDEAPHAGDLTLEGDRQAAARFLGLFPRPAPVQPASLRPHRRSAPGA